MTNKKCSLENVTKQTIYAFYFNTLFFSCLSLHLAFSPQMHVLPCILPFYHRISLFLKTFLCNFGQLLFSPEFDFATICCQHTQGIMIFFLTSLWNSCFISNMRCLRHQFMHFYTASSLFLYGCFLYIFLFSFNVEYFPSIFLNEIMQVQLDLSPNGYVCFLLREEVNSLPVSFALRYTANVILKFSSRKPAEKDRNSSAL